jgi:bifunctional non-homologous end joining protein LigD
LLDDLDLVSVPKASGGKGIHIHVPVDDATFDETKLFARATAELVAARCPDLVVTRMAKAERAGRVFIDWSQNDPWKSIVAPWSPRGLARPMVAAPLDWEDVERAAESGETSSMLVTIDDVARRLDERGDPAAALRMVHQGLPRCAR